MNISLAKMNSLWNWIVYIYGWWSGRSASEKIELVPLVEPTSPSDTKSDTKALSIIKPSKKHIHLNVIRSIFTDVCTIGELTCLEEPMLKLVTLEPAELPPPIKPRAIPAGTYAITLYSSPHLGYKVPLLHDVDDFSDVEFHVGNYPRDTKGCILVGLKQEGNSIGFSKSAFEFLMVVLKDAETIHISIS